MFGFVCQCLALVFEASRLIMIQLLLHGLKVCRLLASLSKHALSDRGVASVSMYPLTLPQMDPIVSLHYYAPVCALINAIIIPFTEGMEPFYALHRVGILVLLSNAGMAFALNVSWRVCFSVADRGTGRRCVLDQCGVWPDLDHRRGVQGHRTSSLAIGANADPVSAPDHRLCPGVWIAHHSRPGDRLLVSLHHQL